MLKWSAFWTTFTLIFLAEMGDKTQLAVITLSAKTGSPASVLIGAALSLTFVSLIGVVVGAALGQYLPAGLLEKIAAIAFIVIGVLMLLGKF